MNIFISQIFIFVCNSIISVIYYKVYNELPGVGTAAKTLISVKYYNMYNVTKWAPFEAHQDGRNGARVQHSTPGSIEAPGTAQKGHRLQHSTPGSIEAHQERRNGAPGNTPHLAALRHQTKKNGLQTICSP